MQGWGAVCGPVGQTNMYTLDKEDLVEFVSGTSHGWQKKKQKQLKCLFTKKSRSVFAANFVVRVLDSNLGLAVSFLCVRMSREAQIELFHVRA